MILIKKERLLQPLGEMNISKHDVSINNMQSIKNKISDLVNLSTIDTI